MDLNAALRAFDQTESNLLKSVRIWNELVSLIPEHFTYEGSSPNGIRYRQLLRSFYDVRDALPSIGGWKPLSLIPSNLDEITASRTELYDPTAPRPLADYNRSLQEPGDELDEYRHRFTKMRRLVVRARLEELSAQFERVLQGLVSRVPSMSQDFNGPEVGELTGYFQEIDRLVGNTGTRSGRWNDLYRHLRFHQPHDIIDISETDWPVVREDISKLMYAEEEPTPVGVDDLEVLVSQKPSGSAVTKLDWGAISDEDFELLMFKIVQESTGYENVQLLMRTRAADRGRDLQALRVRVDTLSGTTRERVIIQCKHWQSKSLALPDVVANVEQMRLWEPPRVDSLVIATSGFFTADAVQWVEQRNERREAPRVELWSQPHIASLIAQRPHLAIEFKLR
jgi:hypothetical protein